MKKSRLVPLLLLPLTIGFFTACGPQTTSSGINLTNIIPAVPEVKLDYYEERTYEYYSVSPPLVYKERVWHSANGDFRIECDGIFENINGKLEPLPPQKVAEYNDRWLTGGFGLAVMDRGFRIRNPETFLENYNYTVLNASEPYLQRQAVVVRITSLHQDRPNYTVWFDNKNGMVLKYIEDTLAVNPLSVMEITALDLNPDLSGITFFHHDIHEEPVTYPEITQLDYKVFNPLYIPPGFVPGPPMKVELHTKSGKVLTSLKVTLCDGLQEIIISQYKSINPNGSKPGLWPSPVYFVRLGGASMAGIHVTVFSIRETDIRITHNIHEEEVAAIIDSLSPLQK